MPDHLAAEHLTLDELADLSVDELSGPASEAAQRHLESCPHCRSELDQLAAELDRVAGELGSWADPAPTAMPVTVAARLDRVLAEASEARQTGAGPERSTVVGSTRAERAGVDGGGPDTATVSPLRRTTPLKAPATATYVKQTGAVRIMLAAAVAAAVVGFGGYVLSATAGLNEPSALSPTLVHPDALATQARTLADSRDLDAHPFSAAWRCARKVTTGRITGIAPVYVDGEQNYLVYTRSSGISYATLVSGCDSGQPTAQHTAKLSE
jgi:hypothetical protein